MTDTIFSVRDAGSMVTRQVRTTAPLTLPHIPARVLGSAELAALLQLDPGAGAMGTLAATQRFAQRQGGPGEDPEITTQRAFVNQLVEQVGAARAHQPAEGYRHPTRGVKARLATPAPDDPNRTPRPRRAPLSAADVAWLTRLPTDPTKISDEDAAVVARLAAEAPPDTGDERLARSILEPLTRLHDRRAAQAELRALDTAPRLRPPDNARAVIAAAIRREIPELTEREAAQRADDIITRATTAADTRRTQRQTELRAQIAELTP